MNKQSIVKAILNVCPSSLAIQLGKIHPKIAKNLPPGIIAEVIYYKRFKVSIDTTYPIESCMVSGIYAPMTVKVLESFIDAGDVMIDIGANVGAISLVASALVSEKGMVIAIEPGLLTFDRLAKTVITNKLNNVRIIRCGVSDKRGIMQWKLDRNNLGNAGLVEEGGDEVVNVDTLDNLVSDLRLPTVSFIKIDVEGMEFPVLRGSIGILKRYRPSILFETMAAWRKIKGDKYFQEMEDFLKSLGYSLYTVNPPYCQETSLADTTDDTLAVCHANTKALRDLQNICRTTLKFRSSEARNETGC